MFKNWLLRIEEGKKIFWIIACLGFHGVNIPTMTEYATGILFTEDNFLGQTEWKEEWSVHLEGQTKHLAHHIKQLILWGEDKRFGSWGFYYTLDVCFCLKYSHSITMLQMYVPSLSLVCIARSFQQLYIISEHNKEFKN